LPWGENIASKAVPPVFIQAKDFPGLNTKSQNVMDSPAVKTKGENASATKQNLFADPPPALAPPIELLKSLAVKEEDNENPLDPDSNTFKAHKYYLIHTHKYKCPHKGCT
jgi:hypothetical protein